MYKHMFRHIISRKLSLGLISISLITISSCTGFTDDVPQENLITFVGHNEQTTSIGLMTSDGQNIRYVTDAVGNELLPKWSPDGKYLAYLSDRQVPLGEHTQQLYNLWLFDLSTGQTSGLTQDGQVTASFTEFAWAPNSDKIIYDTSRGPVKIIHLTDLSNDTLGFYLGSPFAWSKRDEIAMRDAFIEPAAIYSLAVVDSNYNPVLPPANGFRVGGHYGLNTATSLAWHPKERKLAIGSYFAARGDCDLRIAVIHKDTVTIQASLAEKFGDKESGFRSFRPPSKITDLAWSPDGKKIAFRFIYYDDPELANDDIEQIVVTNSELTEFSALTPESMRCNKPQWSPDSTRLVFACQGEGEGNSDIWMVNNDGSGLKQLTDSPTYEGEPVWQPRP